MAGGGPWGVSGFNGVVEVGQVGEPLSWQAFEFDETPAIGACARFVLFSGEGLDEVVGGDWL